MKRIFTILIPFSFLIFFSCMGSTYFYNLESYPSKPAAYSAQDAFLSDLQKKIGEPLSAPLSSKKILVGVPNLETFKKVVDVRPYRSTEQKNDAVEFVSTVYENDFLAMAEWVKNKNIYKESEIVRTNGGHLQPSENEDVLYLYVEPPLSMSWYIADQKYGKQTIAPDNGIVDPVEKNRSWLQSIQAFAIRE